MNRAGITISNSFHRQKQDVAVAWGQFIHSTIQPDYWITFNVKHSTDRQGAEQHFHERIVAVLSRKKINTGWKEYRQNGKRVAEKIKLNKALSGFSQHIIYSIDYDLNPIRSVEAQSEYWHFHVGLKFELQKPPAFLLETLIMNLWDGDFHLAEYRDGGASEYGYSKHRHRAFSLGCPRTGACNHNGRTCKHEDKWSALLNGINDKKGTV